MVKNIHPDELMERYQTARQIIFRYQLDKLETSALRTAMSSIEKSMKDILSQPTKRLKRWEQIRRQELIKEIDRLTLGIREQVSGVISSLAGQAGAESAIYHSQSMSLGGKVKNFNNVALSSEQFQSFFQTTPLGGSTLTQWVDKAFDATVRQGILEDLGAGVLQGKGYPGLVDGIMGHMKDFTRKEAVTLARTFVQTANCEAMKSVMRANSDIVKKWKWSSVLENSNLRTGTGTCLICASLDGNKYNLGDGPAIPKHPNCRCVQIPQTVSFRELGINIDELEEVARPWTTRQDIPIGEGGRTILTWGKHQGEYASWLESRGEKFQKNVVGPRRYELIQSGKVKFKDLVDPETGRLYRLDELVGGGAKNVPDDFKPIRVEVFGKVSKGHVDRVQKHFDSLPPGIQKTLSNYGTRFTVSPLISDIKPKLKGVRPRGWPKGMTWDNADGLHDSLDNMVVVTEKRINFMGKTIDAPRVDYVFYHETGHALDSALAPGDVKKHWTDVEKWKQAYAKDKAAIPKKDKGGFSYFLQEDGIGSKETFAEMFENIMLDKRGPSSVQKNFQNCAKVMTQLLREIK